MNRSVTGSMNDLINHAKAWLSDGELSPHDVEFAVTKLDVADVALDGRDLASGRPAHSFYCSVEHWLAQID